MGFPPNLFNFKSNGTKVKKVFQHHWAFLEELREMLYKINKVEAIVSVKFGFTFA
jgi:hypothetical protein